MSVKEYPWLKIAELVLMLIAIIGTGIGVAVDIKSQLVTLNNEIVTLKQSHQELSREFSSYRADVDNLKGIHDRENAMIHENIYQQRRKNYVNK